MKKIISIGNPSKGGVSKTTTAINLAYGLNINHKVLVLDLDRSKQFSKFNSVYNSLKVQTSNTHNDLKKILSSSDAEYIVIDLGGFDSELQRWAMYWSDIIIIPVSNSDSDLIELPINIDILNQSIFTKDNDYSKCLVLPSRVHHFNSSLHPQLREVLKDEDRIELMELRISQLSVYEKMLGSGLSVFQMGSQRAIDDNQNLVNKIIEECK